MTRLTLLTRDGCHLCDTMKSVVAQVQRQHPVVLTEVNIAGHPELEQRHGTEIPVLLSGERVIARVRISVSQLRERLSDLSKGA